MGLLFMFVTNCTNFFNMLFAIFVTKYVDKETFALYSVITSVALGLGAFYQIIHYLISKHTVKYETQKNFNLKNILNVIFNFSLFVGLILTILSYLIINYFYKNIDSNFYIYLYILFTTFFVCLTNTQLGILNGKEFHKTYALFVFFTSILRFGSLLFFIFLFTYNYAPFFSNIFANITLFLLLLFFFKINYFFTDIKSLLENAKNLYASFIHEKRIIIFNIILLFILYSDVFFYSIDRPIEEISSYSVHSIYAKILYFFIIPLSIFFFPQFSKRKFTFTIKNLFYLLLTTIVLNIFFHFSIKFFFKFFYSSYEFNIIQFIFLSITFSCLALFQISGEYLVTRYVKKIYIFFIIIIALIFIIFNLINNVYFVEIYCFSLILMLSVNILFYYKYKVN